MYMKIVFFLLAFFILKKTDQKCGEKIQLLKIIV